MKVNTYTTGTGQTLTGVHHENLGCTMYGCVIHHPTDHPMKEFKTHWRADRGIMERICPHGVGHPDPDDSSFIARTLGDERAKMESIHGCDGCCDTSIRNRV